MNRLTDQDVAELVQRFFQEREHHRRLSINALITTTHGGRTSSDDVVAVADRIAQQLQTQQSERDHSPTPLLDQTGQRSPSAEWPEVAGYDIVDFLGCGGMGNVFEAYQRSTGRRVAMKFLRDVAISRESMRRRFEREIELVARLQHPAIVSVLDAGPYLDRYFFVMDYIEGTMLDVAFPPGKCNVRQAMRVMGEICDAVEYAHQRGVLHRDLKPSNILIDGDGHPHLVDFGLAKAIDHEPVARRHWTISAPGQILGTLSYMSPEQSRGDVEELSVRSDVYSIGVMAYELITGCLPCEVDGSLEEVLHRINTIPPVSPSSLRRASNGGSKAGAAVRWAGGRSHGLRRILGDHADLDAILLKSLEKSPRDRYPTVQALTNDIRGFLNHGNVRARRASAMTRLVRWTSRNRRVAITAATSLMVIVTVVVAAFWEVTRERDRAVEAQQTAVLEQSHARISELRAKRQAQISHTAAAYLADVFRLLDPAGVKGGRVNAREVLDNSLAGTHQLDDQPLGKAMVLQAIGAGWKNLGRYDRAARIVEEALALRRHSNEVSAADVAESLNELGSICHLRGDFQAAEEYYCESVALLRRSETDRAALGTTLTNLGWVLIERAENVEGENLIRESLELQRQVFAEPHAEIAISLNRLGLALHGQQRFQEAEAAHVAAVKMHRSLFGDEHMLIAHDLENLAGTVAGLRRWDDSLSLFKQSLEMRRQVLPAHHPDIARSLHYYGNMILALRGPAAAKPLLEECVAIRRQVLPGDHPYLAQALALLGRILMQTSDCEAALPLLEESREILADQLRQYFPEGDAPVEYCDHASHLGGMGAMALEPQNLAELAEDLGLCLTQLGQYEQAEHQLESAIRGCEAIFGTDHERTARVRQRLAELYRQWHQEDGAAATALE